MDERDPALKQAYNEIKARAEAYVADHPDYVLYPDPGRVEGVLEGLARRKLRFGDYYCPCRVMKHEPEADASIVCPCPAGVEELATQGYCKCHLFATVAYAESHDQT